MNHISAIDRLKLLHKERYNDFVNIDDWHDAIEKDWPKLLAVVEAAKNLDAYRYTNQWGSVSDSDLRELRVALQSLEK